MKARANWMVGALLLGACANSRSLLPGTPAGEARSRLPVVSVGEVGVEHGLVSYVSDAAVPLGLGSAAPLGLWGPDVALGEYGYRLWSGQCTGTGRGYQCAGGVEVVKANDLTQPAIAAYHTPQRATAMFADLPYLYVTWCAADTLAGLLDRGGGGLKILDSSDQNTFVEIGSSETSCAQGITLAGNYAYLATWRGLVGVDVSQPTRPIRSGVYTTEGFPTRVAVSGGLAYVLWETPLVISGPTPVYHRSLRVLDVSNPGSITAVGAYALAATSIKGQWRHPRRADDPAESCLQEQWRPPQVAVVDGYLYIPIRDDTWKVWRLTEASGQ